MLRAVLSLVALLFVGCTPVTREAAGEFDYLGQLRILADAAADGTVVGGLSGISYDAGRQVYYVISDDRSEKNPARFYTVRIPLSTSGIEKVEFIASHRWLDRDGKPFRPLDLATRPPVVPPDPEGIAFDGRGQRLYWSSEGGRLSEEGGGPAQLDTWVRIAGLDGGFLGELVLPPTLAMSGEQTGPRPNRGLEGLTMTPSGRYLWAAMEGPGLGDGEVPTERQGALTRITRFDTDTDTGAATAQYAYPLEKVSAGPGGDNGLTDLVAVDDERFLAVERGYGTRVSARVYGVEIGDADDVLARPSLAGAAVRPVTKTLVADLTTTAGLSPLDNVEGITLGPKLADGRQTVVLVTDDNFSPRQITQFLAFAI